MAIAEKRYYLITSTHVSGAHRYARVCYCVVPEIAEDIEKLRTFAESIGAHNFELAVTESYHKAITKSVVEWAEPSRFIDPQLTNAAI